LSADSDVTLVYFQPVPYIFIRKINQISHFLVVHRINIRIGMFFLFFFYLENRRPVAFTASGLLPFIMLIVLF
jgi:hypothetical protein